MPKVTLHQLRKSPRQLRIKMFLNGASHPCLPLRVGALETAQQARETTVKGQLLTLGVALDTSNGLTHGAQ